MLLSKDMVPPPPPAAAAAGPLPWGWPATRGRVLLFTAYLGARDKDQRYMSCSDLAGELQKDIKMDAAMELRICTAVLKRLDDTSNDVQSKVHEPLQGRPSPGITTAHRLRLPRAAFFCLFSSPRRPGHQLPGYPSSEGAAGSGV